MIALLKDGDHEVPNNYRPVSLLIAFSKIYDRVVLNQLTEYLVRHKRLFKHQSNNKKFHSTETLNTFHGRRNHGGSGGLSPPNF